MISNLPAHVDIERLTLGYSLLKSEHLDTARAFLEPDDFSLEKHRRIWRRMCELYDSGKPVDRVTLYQELSAHGEAESIGGISCLVELDEGLPANPHMDGYLDRLREATLRRRMIASAHHLAGRAADETESADDVLSAFAAVSTDLAKCTSDGRRPISTHDLIASEGITALLEARQHRGIHLPWEKLDRDLSGFGPGQLIVLMAATSRGKTSLALQVAAFAALQDCAPVIWTMEMSPKSLFRRMVTQLSAVWTGKRQLTFEERRAQGDAIARLDERPIYFDAHSRSVGSFMASIRQVRSRTAVGLAVVDYLQLIRGGGKNRTQEVSDNSRALKLAAMDLQIPILALSQVDRGSVKGEGAKIGLHSGKESGDIENDADVMLWIEGGELSRDSETAVSLHIGKQREGAAGFSIPMIFRPTSQTFMEATDANE